MRNSIFILSVTLLGLIAIVGIYVISNTLDNVNAQPEKIELDPSQTKSSISIPATDDDSALPHYEAAEVIITVEAPSTR